MRRALPVALLVVAGCAGADPQPAPPPAATTAPSASPAAEARDPSRDEQIAAELQTVFRHVAGIRGLPVKHPVKSQVLDRAKIVAKIKAHVLEDIPADVITAEGETLVGFELVPADYDYLEGNLKMLEGQIAGLYIPSDKTLYVVDDLSDAEAAETVAHELVHALQDQSFDIDKPLKFKLGESDRINAAHALIEGDATVAMMEVGGQPTQDVDSKLLAKLMFAGSALSGGPGTPPVLLASLVAPYADGFAFVQERRRAGGWAAVNAAFEHLPQTTEQLLHPDKYASREPAIVLPPIDPAPLGAGFTERLADDQGEQGLRVMLGAWAKNPDAASAAASGWGGDRALLAEKKAGGDSIYATAYRVRFDAPKLADGMAAILTNRWTTKCTERKTLGPVAWKRQGADIVMVAGPYQRTGKAVRSAGTCADATRWIDAILKKR